MSKLQRIMLDGGFTCPNRDNTVGSGGCSYCRNDSFAPEYCRSAKSITEQLEAGKRFFGQKYKDMEYIAYFQSYSCTYAPIEVLRQRYEEALSVEGVRELIIGTRPDCLQDEVLDLLEEFNARTRLTIEIGVESCHDHVLQRINRGHTLAQAVDAIRRTATRGIRVGVHIILGLPEESEEEMVQGAEMLSELPIDFIKLHQLQILKDTRMADDYRERPEDFVTFPTAECYVSFVKEYRKHLRSDITIERYVSSAPSDLVIAPRWGLKPYEIKTLIERGRDVTDTITIMEQPILNSHNKEEHRPSHTAEHLLNQTMVRMFGCERSKNAHIERKKSKINYNLAECPTAEQIAEIERKMNELIAMDMPVAYEFVTRDNIPEGVKLDKLPEYASETLRLVRIGDYDICPCIGQHVGSTGEIGEFKITSTSYTDGSFRIVFKVNSEKQ